MRANRPFVVENVQTDPRCSGTEMAQIYAEMGVQSLLNIPMLADGTAPVFLYVHHQSPRKWQAREIQLCQQVAEQFWSILSRASAESVRDKAEEMLNLALSLAQLGAMDHDYKSGVQRMSDGFLKLIGHPELASKSRLGFLDIEYLNIVHPDDQDRFAAKVADSIAKGEDFELDDKHRIITAAGETRRIHYKSRTHFAIIIDTTESTLQAEASAQAQDRLHKMSRLTAMGTMASTLAHELNQPLTAAANYLNVLRALDQKDSSMDGYSRADVLDLAAHSVLDAGQIIKKMRNFTSGGNLQRAPVSLAAIADNAVRHANGKVAQGTLEIIINVPKRLMIDVDAMQIEQILANLLRNAAEAMTHQHNGKITLSACEHDGFVDLHVTDNGPGIPDDFAAGLFNPFQSSKSEGMGLGLSLLLD
jgi:C4-dicarboxylate-specific signal transduction histidine kinase